MNTLPRPPKLPSFVAIDFESANEALTSACSVGAVIVRNYHIEEEFYSLIQPRPNIYRFWNTKIHGLTDKDTNEAPLFPEVWDALAPKVVGLPMIAHGKDFDERTLKTLLEYYHIPFSDIPFHCTHKWSENLFPELENHKLFTVAAACGFDLTQQHHALADARACAAIGIKIFR